MHQKQVFVRGLDGRTLVMDLASDALVSELKEGLRARLGLPCDQQRLVLVSGRPLDDSDALEAGCSLDLSLRLVGGVIEPSLRILAQKYNCDKMICRKEHVLCYTTDLEHPRLAVRGIAMSGVNRLLVVEPVPSIRPFLGEGNVCYARLHPKATNCRKRKCGHSNNLRPKKKLK